MYRTFVFTCSLSALSCKMLSRDGYKIYLWISTEGVDRRSVEDLFLLGLGLKVYIVVDIVTVLTAVSCSSILSVEAGCEQRWHIPV